jgi:hypothetical protein
MATCNGCGGVVGRDCFNPSECEWIAQDMERQEVMRQAESVSRDAVNKQSGISLRDAMAMSVRIPDDYSAKWGEALIGEQAPNSVEPVSVHIDWWMRVEAAYRYRMADAMLKARENKS